MNFYLKCVRALDQVGEYRGNVKTAIFDLLGQNSVNKEEVRKVYSLCIQTLQNSKQLDEALRFLSDVKKVPIKNRNLAKVLLNELLFGKFKTVKGGGAVKRLLMENLPAIKKELNIVDDINGNSTSNGAVDRSLIKSQVFIRTIKERVPVSYYQKFVENGEVKVDDIVPNAVQMEYKAYQKLKEHENFENQNTYVLQSKSSCLPPVCLKDYCEELDLGESFDIIDGCSAPGNKTFQIAEYFPQCTVYGIEKNPRRYTTLCNRSKLFALDNVQCVQADFLSLDPNDKKYQNVKIIALDPSCSGSGMQNQIEATKLKCTEEDFEAKVAEHWKECDAEVQSRVQNLGAMQYSLLDHAMKFPNLCYLIYSTCSIYPAENELVVKKLLTNHIEKLRLVEALPNWKIRGFSSQLTNAKKCVREVPGRNSNDGFFVAMFKVKKEMSE